MRITVFTPAYNRGYIIENLYRSLQRQSFRDFEWLVVDDGSSDDTSARFDLFLSEENDFPIRYIKTENGGKHRAINRGVKEAKGELFFIVDSDDYITDDALEWIDRVERSIPQDEKGKFAGVCGLRGYDTEHINGTTFSGDCLDITTLEREEHNITGDKAEAFYTQVMRCYPFPEFEGERFITECVVWDRIAADGLKVRFFNRISIICNYLEDGLTAKGNALLLRNPQGYALFIRQRVSYGKLKGLEMWGTYSSFAEGTKDRFSFMQICKMLHANPITLWARLLGLKLFYTLYD